MATEKIIKQWEVYLTWNEIVEKFDVVSWFIYDLYNQWKVRYIFKKKSKSWQLCDIIHFNLDDVRENINNDWYEIYKKTKLESESIK